MSLSYSIAKLLAEEKTTVSDIDRVLTRYKLRALFPSIADLYRRIASHKKLDNTLMIETPFPLSEASLEKIHTVVGKEVTDHEVTINKALLAGFKARFQGKLYDGSADRIIKQLMSSV